MYGGRPRADESSDDDDAFFSLLSIALIRRNICTDVYTDVHVCRLDAVIARGRSNFTSLTAFNPRNFVRSYWHNVTSLQLPNILSTCILSSITSPTKVATTMLSSFVARQSSRKNGLASSKSCGLQVRYDFYDTLSGITAKNGEFVSLESTPGRPVMCPKYWYDRNSNFHTTYDM